MPTSYKDQFYEIDPYNPPPAGTAMNVLRLEMIDQNNDGDLDRFNGDSVDGVDITESYPGDRVWMDVPGEGLVLYTGITFYLDDGRQLFTPTDGQALEDGTLRFATGVTTQGPLDFADLGPTCFTAGMLVDTPTGRIPVERLEAGDLVTTLDSGARPLLHVARARHRAIGAAAPVRFAPGALGSPEAFAVSQQHRILLRGWRAEMFFGTEEVLVPARHMVNGDTIRIVEGGVVDYVHLLFARHEIVTAAGVPSESYFPGHALDHAGSAQQDEITRLFPDLVQGNPEGWRTARPVIRRHEALAAFV
ncbi:MAG: Hint domain-containing protein [Paracoccaceae bacterium]